MNLSKLASRAGMAAPGHDHFAERLLSRRGFLEKTGLTAGALAAAGLIPEVARSGTINRAASTAHGHHSTTTATPLPIPGGLQLLGPSGPLFHVFLPATGVEPSTITNFNGFSALAYLNGTATDADGNRLAIGLSDMRVFQGSYRTTDGSLAHGTFAFI